MSDRFRRTAPLKITFLEGERTGANKLTAVANQARNGLGLLEKVIGDPWNQSGDSWLAVDFELQIPNLARMIGANRYLNPAIYFLVGDPSDSNTFKYTETLDSKFPGESTGYLLYKPASGSTYVEAGGGGHFTTPVAREDLVLAAGDYWVDETTGRFRTFTPFNPTGSANTLTYKVDPSDWVKTAEAIPGVIPDPRQTEFTGCRISQTSSKFFMHLPPRRPLTLTDRDSPSNYPDSGDILGNSASSVTPGDYRFFQVTGTALADEHYRYSFPPEIRDQIAGMTDGEILPDGYLYLWDIAGNTVIEGVVFKKPTEAPYNSQPWELEEASDSFDFSLYLSADETDSSYSSTSIGLVVSGSPLSRSIWTLNNAFYQHQHNNAGAFSSPVSHNELDDLNPPISTGAEHAARYPTTLPAWPGSHWNNDSHTSLLSRGGSQSAGLERDINNNAMLGDLLMGSSTASSGNFLNVTANSRRLRFGTLTGPSIFGRFGTNYALTLVANNIVLTNSTSGAEPPADVYIFYPSATMQLKDNAAASSSLSQTSPGIELMSFDEATIGEYTPAIKFGFDDPQFSTIPAGKTGAAIAGRVTETYAADTDAGMALDFFTIDNDAGASPAPVVRASISQTGNFGIGTTAPVNKLDVDGAAVIGSGASYAGSATAPTDGLLVQGRVVIGNTSGSNLLTVAGGATIGAGYTGVTAPTNGLQVEGNVGIGTAPISSRKFSISVEDQNTMHLAYHGTSGNNTIEMSHSRGTTASPTASQSGDVVGMLNFQAYDGVNGNENIARITAVVDGTMGDGDAPGRLVFFTTPDGGSTVNERMRITNAGNVGIGTTNPQNRLDVEGAVAIGAAFSGTSAAPTNGAIIEGAVGIGTASVGAFKVAVAGDVGPEANNTRSLGAAATGWANIYGGSATSHKVPSLTRTITASPIVAMPAFLTDIANIAYAGGATFSSLSLSGDDSLRTVIYRVTIPSGSTINTVRLKLQSSATSNYTVTLYRKAFSSSVTGAATSLGSTTASATGGVDATATISSIAHAVLANNAYWVTAVIPGLTNTDSVDYGLLEIDITTDFVPTHNVG